MKKSMLALSLPAFLIVTVSGCGVHSLSYQYRMPMKAYWCDWCCDYHYYSRYDYGCSTVVTEEVIVIEEVQPRHHPHISATHTTTTTAVPAERLENSCDGIGGKSRPVAPGTFS